MLMALSPPEHPAWGTWVERGRTLTGTPSLTWSESRRRATSDRKFLIGDLFLEVPKDERVALEEAIGVQQRAEQYAEVSAAWPPATRLDTASWAVHRELRHEPDRFMTIRPGMTVREARRARGCPDGDAKPRHRRSIDERVQEVIAELQDATVHAALKDYLRRQEDDRRLVKLETEADKIRKHAVYEIKQRQKLLRGARSAHTGFLEHIEALHLHEQDVWAVQDWLTEGDEVPPHLVEKLSGALSDLGKAAFQVLALVARRASGSPELLALPGGGSCRHRIGEGRPLD